MSSQNLMLLAAVLVAVTVAVPATRAQASHSDVLARLARIARGGFTPAPLVKPGEVPYATEIKAAARRHGISPALLAALVRAESAFDPYAVSRVGARGLGQLMPGTARKLGVTNSFDPEQNLDGAARYLAEQFMRFGTPRRALAAYNAGPERARRPRHTWPEETRVYVDRVLRFEREYVRCQLP